MAIASSRTRPPQKAALPPVGRISGLSRSGRESVVAAVVAAGALVVLAMWWHDTPTGSLRDWGSRLTAAGDITALLGTYLVLIQLVLMGRIPWLERLLGMDRLAVWHRRNGQYSVSLLVAHTFLTIWGYALSAHAGPASETKTVVLSYPDVLAATVGLGLFLAVAVTSARAARRRLAYQTWYFIHLYTYLAIALSFSHQLATGNDFVTHRGNRLVWVAIYVLTVGLFAVYRFGAPIRNALRTRLQVVNVVAESPTTTSIYIGGNNLEALGAQSGQFFLWRFLTRDGWWQAHPFSLSAAPNGEWLRVTVKDAGDFTRTLRGIQPGTRVLAEGPYGAFTAQRRTQRRVLMIAGGIGITPLRALLESLPARKGDLTLLYRASSDADLVLRDELDVIAKRRGAAVHYLVGPRSDGRDPLGPEGILRLCPDVAARDVFVCGPEGLNASLRATLERLGVPRRQIHSEDFGY